MENIYHGIKIVLLLVALHETKCTILKIPELVRPHVYDIPIIDLKGVDQSIIYTRNDSNDNTLLQSILKEAFTSQPVLLLRGKVEETLRDKVNNKSPNIVLLTESLNIRDLEDVTFKNVLISYWSALYLVITTRSQNFICKNGTLTDKAFAVTKKYLNRLWQVHRIVRVSVTFPYTCPMHYVIYDGKEMSGTVLYNRDIRFIRPKTRQEYATDFANSGDLRDLTNGYPLRANIFYRFPTSITECDVVSQFTNIDYESSTGVCGLDGMLMHDYMKYYKYQLIIVKDESCDKYGYKINNTLSGSIGCVLRNEIDISFNSRFIWLYTSKRFHFLHYVYQDTLAAAIKRPNKIPLWHYPYNIFTIYTWMCLLLCTSLLGAVAWFKAKMAAKTGENILTLRFYMFNAIYSTFFGVLVKNDGKYRILKGSSLISSIILLSVYQGHFSYQFTTCSHYPELMSAQQLFASSHVIYTSQSMLNFIKPLIDPYSKSIPGIMERMRIRNATTIDYLLQHSIDPPGASIERKRDIMLEATYNHTDKYGMPEIYTMDLAFQSFYLSFIGSDGFLFIEESQIFMMRLTESGLPNLYYKWTGYTYSMGDRWPGSETEPRPFKSLTIKKFRVAYVLLFTGYFISGLVFIIERWRFHLHKNCFCCKSK